MKTGIKWLLGILIGLAVVAILSVAAVLIFNRWNHAGAVLGRQANRFRSDGQIMPWRYAPRQGMPFNSPPENRMPMMRSGWGSPLARLGIFNPLRFIFLCLICIGFLVLIVLGIVYLVSPKKPAAVAVTSPAKTATPAAAPEITQPGAAATHVCQNCGREVQQDWSHCAYCGAPLTGL